MFIRFNLIFVDIFYAQVQPQTPQQQQGRYTSHHTSGTAGQTGSTNTQQETDSPAHCPSDREEYSHADDAFNKQVKHNILSTRTVSDFF